MSQETLNQRLNAEQAAKFLNCSVSFIRKETKNGNLAHIRMGARFYYLESDLLTLFKRVEPHTNADSLE